MKTKHASVEDVLKIKGKSVIFHTDFTVTDESHIERLKKVLDHLILKNKITIIVAKGDMGSYLDQYSRHDYKLIQCSTLQHVIQYFARMQNNMDHIIVANNVVKSMLGRRRFSGLMYVDIGDEIVIPRALPVVKAKEVIPTQQHQLTISESTKSDKPLKYVFVIPSYNNEPYYRKNLDSVVSQTYTNWRIIYVDDASTDRTYELVQKYINEKGIKDKVKLIRNDKNYKQAYSRYIALKECDDDEICCFVDGDDWLYDVRVLEKTNQLYMKGNVELTYGGMHKCIYGKTGSKCVSKSFSSDVIKNNSYRKQPWSVLHLRTGYARLFKNAPEDYYKDHNGDWLKCSTDMALMWWGLEQCNGKFKHVDFSSYVYNVDASVRFENSYERKNKTKEWNDYRGKVTRRLINCNIKDYNREIKIIYVGDLIESNGIMDIINDFELVCQNRKDMTLRFLYKNINGSSYFKDTINKYIDNCSFIDFVKQTPIHSYESYIKDSEIILKWGSSHNINTFKTYIERYKIKVLTDDFDYVINTDIIYLDKMSDIKNILCKYDIKHLVSSPKSIIYLAASSLPKICGYSIRTKHILEEVSKEYKIICFVRANYQNRRRYISIYVYNNIIYYNVNYSKKLESYLNEYIHTHKNTLIWSASNYEMGLISSRVSKKQNIKSIYEVRGLWHYTEKSIEMINNNKFDANSFNKSDKFEKDACNLNDYVLCENEQLYKMCIEKYRVNKDNIYTLKNGVCCDLLKKKNIDFNKKTKITFGYIGSISSYEGIKNLITQFRKLEKTYNTELHIIGGGTSDDSIKIIKSIQNTIQNDSRIKYFGQIKHHELQEYYDNIDIICLPRVNCEVSNLVTPLKPFEAMSKGKLVLASSVDAISEVITNNVNGILFNKTNPSDLYLKIKDILDGKYNINNMIENAYSFCQSNTWGITCKNALNILDEIEYCKKSKQSNIPNINIKYDFKLPERTDNEIRLIYYGTLCDENNTLEIIKEFQKIHKERPEVVLKFVYRKIHGDSDFKKELNEYIHNGIDGVTFKYNLSHRDTCYEIATSDIGICWRKNGWGDNGEVITNVKEYELYGLNIIFDKILFNYKIIKDIIFIKHNINKFLKTLIYLKNKYHNTRLFPYVLHNAFPYDSGGYATRTHNILNTFNSMYNDKQYFALHRMKYPYDTHKMKYVDKLLHEVDNVCYLTLPNLKCYDFCLNLLRNMFNITTFHVASAYKNAIPIINYCNKKNISSIYEVRGMWQITGVSRHIYYNTSYNKSWLSDYELKEKHCIQNCSKPLFITSQLQGYALNDNKYKYLPPLDCNIPKTPIFWNCYNIEENILRKKRIYKNDGKFIIGYAGSIVFYEGIVEIINVIEKLFKKNYNIEFRLIGNIEPLLDEYKKKGKDSTKLMTIFNKSFVKLYGRIDHKDINAVISDFDLYVIPRIDLPVTNIVSPIKPFEPMSLKIPLLMSDCDCLKDISDNGKNCVLFKKSNWYDCFRQIKNIIDIGYPEDILEQGYNFVKNKRNWKYMIKNIGLYKMLV